MSNPMGLTTAEFIAQYGSAPQQGDKKPTVRVEGCAACDKLHRGISEEMECLRQFARTTRRKR